MSARILHVGPGNMALPPWLPPAEEVRLDIDPTFGPHIVADMCDMGEIGQFGFIYSCHNLEHLYPHDVPKALAEFYRVLVPGGLAIISVPDLEGIQPTEDVLYVSPRGPVTGLDMIYGMREALEGEPHMAHHTGFIKATLRQALEKAGFQLLEITTQPAFTILAMAKKPLEPEPAPEYLVEQFRKYGTKAANLPIPADPQTERKYDA